MEVSYVFVCLINIILISYSVNAQRTIHGAIDREYLNNLLDADECDRQMSVIRNDPTLYASFADAGLRFPNGVLGGNLADLGSYHQCLSIDDELGDDLHIQGKYCSLIVLGHNFDIKSKDSKDVSTLISKDLQVGEETLARVLKYNTDLRKLLERYTRVYDGSINNSTTKVATLLPGVELRVSLCIPRPCTSEQFLSSMILGGPIVSDYFEDFCRFPGDKTWSSADTAAVVVFSVLGLVTLISTCYDITYRFKLKKDIAQVNKWCQSFSVYTNGKRLTTFSSGPGTLQCLDGIRAIAMLWVVIGHSYTTEILVMNPITLFNWLYSGSSVWITLAPMAVDMFFTLSGLLLVYTTAEKMKSSTFLRNIHWFYINRIVRIVPLLATAVLLEASLFNRSADGPIWSVVEFNTNMCRKNWWSTLLFVQNFVHPDTACLVHSWYLAIDMNLYIVSPLVLYWVLSNSKRQAWISLTASLLVILAASTAYIFHIDVPGGQLAAGSYEDPQYDYYLDYYINVLARASPFFVGMMFRYILHIYKNKKIQLSPIKVVFLWICVISVFGSIAYFEYEVKRWHYDQPVVDNIMNSFMRPAWGAALCLLIVACVHGYGGPVNWFLSLGLWRMPSRLSYAIYLFHYSLMFLVNSTEVAPVFYSPGRYFFKFLSHMALAVAVAFMATLLIDTPISFLFKKMMTSGTTKVKKEPESDNDKQVAE